MAFGHVPTPAKHVLLVHTHEHVTGAEEPSRVENTSYITHKLFNRELVNDEPL
jgi:hypothetical protein